jgi:thiol-disulfide isomerase/thioredoxin
VGGLALAAIALAFARYEHDLQYRTLHTGDRLHPLRVASLYGAPYTIAPQGRPMVINVFATWCGPCRAEAPGIAQAASRLRALGIDVVGIDQQESVAQVQAFARDFSVRYPLYVDATGITHSVLGARFIPTTVYVDAHGIIRWEHAGPISAKTLLALPLTAERHDET